jgi:hypothetical protein
VTRIAITAAAYQAVAATVPLGSLGYKPILPNASLQRATNWRAASLSVGLCRLERSRWRGRLGRIWVSQGQGCGARSILRALHR